MPEPLGRLEPEYHAAYQTHVAGPTPATSGALLRAIDPVIQLGVRTYAGTSSPTLRGRAKRLALTAMDSYDPQQASIKTHLMNHLQGLQRYAARQGQALTIPERVGLARVQLSSAEAELEDKLGRAPSLTEVADHTGLSIKKINRVRAYHPGVAEGQFAAAAGDDSSDPSVRGNSPARQQAEFIHGDLSGIDQSILEHSLGLFGAERLSHGAIAKRLNISSGAISQRARRIQSRLDELADLETNRR
jgi:DNA-directed RNA polymerase specialized sigma subunit